MYLYNKNGQTIIQDGVKSRIADQERLYEYSLVESENYVILGKPLNQDNCPLSRKD